VGVQGARRFLLARIGQAQSALAGLAFKSLAKCEGDGAPAGATSPMWTILFRIAAPSGAPLRLSPGGFATKLSSGPALPGTRLRRALPGFGLSQPSEHLAARS